MRRPPHRCAPRCANGGPGTRRARTSPEQLARLHQPARSAAPVSALTWRRESNGTRWRSRHRGGVLEIRISHCTADGRRGARDARPPRSHLQVRRVGHSGSARETEQPRVAERSFTSRREAPP
uniref:Uncharacterized protein n=1 Tax=Arundo donax TaxID=35708 RepID=A0A0A8YQZ6_ARUDO